MWNLKANCPIGKWFAWCPVIEFPTSQKCKKHHSAAHGGNLFNILDAENRDVRSRSARMDKMKKLWLHFCNVTWHLVKWSPTIRQPILVRFGQSQVKQSRFNAFGGIQEPFLLNSFKIRWCMTTILNYFGLFRIIFIWNRDSHLHEAVGGGHRLQAVDGFPKYLLIAKTSLFGFGSSLSPPCFLSDQCQHVRVKLELIKSS